MNRHKDMNPLPRNITPQFCIITPTAYLQQYASQSSMHLVLAHLVDKDPEYAQFYRDSDQFKIMDNGAFELGESYDPDRLIELGQLCQADAIVLPDYPFQDWRVTVKAGFEWSEKIRAAGFYTFFVPQSKTGDWDGWVKAYRWGVAQDDIDIIGMSILGIPNALPHIPKSYARVVATELLMRMNIFAKDQYHHYLGLNAGPALEIPSLIEMGALDSCDSSGPVWAGINGHRYTEDADSFQLVRKISIPVDFDYPMVDDENVLDDIQHNITLTNSLFVKD